MSIDKSNGYDAVAQAFITVRGQSTEGIGVTSVRSWAKTFSPGAAVLDLGCGTGLPISKVLIDEGINVYGIDASPTLINKFQENFPLAAAACEPVEDSILFNRLFDGILAWGLIFLMPENLQVKLIHKVGLSLKPHGKFLFTAPNIEVMWQDVMTKLESISLGASKYRDLLTSSGLSLISEFDDEGENHYYSAIKI